MGSHFLLQCMKVKSESEVAQSCPTLSDPMNCSPPGSSLHGIFQARVLEWGAIAFSEEYWSGLLFPSPGALPTHPGIKPAVRVPPALARGSFTTSTTWEALEDDIGTLLLLSRFSRVRLCATSQSAAHQAPPSLGFSRQEHWSGFPFPSPMHESEK